ncbi:YnfA family protein [Ectobacillus polymachus]|uniref:YnfA family protein n=1 Tax=Ectobacillus polymachus TaxID=1508806 RepID=UPI003A890782
MAQSFLLFIFAGLAEIGGGYLIWLWLREGYGVSYGVVGGLVLVLYGIIPTFQQFPSFGRVYAAYGGIFVALSLLWGWAVDRKSPDFYDWIGASICIVGMSIILWAPRH